MLNFVQKLAAKPSDKMIRITRIVFALILLLVIIFGWSNTLVKFGLPDFVKYILFVFPAIGLVRGILDPGVFRKKIWKWTLVGVAIIMILISFFVIENKSTVATIVPTTVSGEINVNSLINPPSEAKKSLTFSTDFWFGFMGWILLFNALLINNKNITTKNERYGEKVTKIRV